MEKTILLVDDSPEDRSLFKRVLHKAGVTNPVISLRDGSDAIRYLAGDAPYTDREKYPLPGILMLDLQMPECNGFEVLEWLRESGIQGIFVVVLSNQNQIKNINRAYALGAQTFLTKPGNERDLRDVIETYETCGLVLSSS